MTVAWRACPRLTGLLSLGVANLAIAACGSVSPASALELHYAPAENLERIDVQALNGARRTIDMAASLLTDRPIIGALVAAAYRGVTVRLYLDGAQAGTPAMTPNGPFGRLLAAPHTVVKQKRPAAPLMQLKGYCIDGSLFRTGSASFSEAGLKQQDSDLLLFADPHLCSDFSINFEQLWDGKDAE